jgi:hypothetical protein
MFLERCSDESLFEQTDRPGKGTSKMTSQSSATAGAMPAASTTPADAANTRKVLLQEIRVKWGKFSEQELAGLKSNDELVTQLAAKYGLTRDAAQRDADAMRKGRDI